MGEAVREIIMPEIIVRVWLADSKNSPPQSIWRQNGISVTQEARSGPDSIDLRITGDGKDIQSLVELRTDLFFGCDINPSNPWV